MNLSVEPNDAVSFKIHHEDDDVIVVEKPARMVTQPGIGHEQDTLLNGLFARHGAKLQNLGKSRDFGLLHRLDRETSGLLIVALRPRAYDALREMFERREIAKFYWAIVQGVPDPDSGVIRLPIAEYEADNRKVKHLARVSSGGKPAVTAYRVLSSGPAGALVECRAVTGRLHQIRVHLKAIRCPIYGDGLYGPRGVKTASRLALHAHRLKFLHPVTGMMLDVTTGWPRDLKQLMTRLKLTRPGEPSSYGGAERLESSGVESPQEIDGDPILDEDAGVGEDES